MEIENLSEMTEIPPHKPQPYIPEYHFVPMYVRNKISKMVLVDVPFRQEDLLRQQKEDAAKLIAERLLKNNMVTTRIVDSNSEFDNYEYSIVVVDPNNAPPNNIMQENLELKQQIASHKAEMQEQKEWFQRFYRLGR